MPGRTEAAIAYYRALMPPKQAAEIFDPLNTTDIRCPVMFICGEEESGGGMVEMFKQAAAQCAGFCEVRLFFFFFLVVLFHEEHKKKKRLLLFAKRGILCTWRNPTVSCTSCFPSWSWELCLKASKLRLSMCKRRLSQSWSRRNSNEHSRFLQFPLFISIQAVLRWKCTQIHPDALFSKTRVSLYRVVIGRPSATFWFNRT